MGVLHIDYSQYTDGDKYGWKENKCTLDATLFEMVAITAKALRMIVESRIEMGYTKNETQDMIKQSIDTIYQQIRAVEPANEGDK